MSLHLMRHQQDAVNFAIANKGIAAFFHEVGCGKTITALSTFKELRKSDPALTLFVICPLSLIYGAWITEIDKFFPEYNWNDLHGNEAKDCSRPVDIHLFNFEYLIGPRKYDKLDQWFKEKVFSSTPPGSFMCVIDESSKMKNNRIKTVERILSFKKYFKHRIVMSGIPAPNIEWEYWTQMYFLNEDILGDNFYKFKNIFFALRRGTQIATGAIFNRHMIRKLHEQGFVYEILPQKRDELFARMKPWCHSVKAQDCIDLPSQTDEFRRVRMTEQQAEVYKQMKNSYIAELPANKTHVVANVALTKIMKLRQITSGFAIDDNEDPIVLDSVNPKMRALLDIVEEVGKEQMIVWCQFHWEIDTIIEKLSLFGGVSQLHGRVPIHKRKEHLNNFLTGKNQFLVANPSSAGHGLTLVNCRIAVFFSLDYSWESYAQARGRIYRKGQKKHCVYFHLIATNSIDEDVLKIVQRKETATDVAKRYLCS